LKLAIDDSGSGHHSLRLIDLLNQDFQKLDKLITNDSSDRTLKSMVSFCKESDISLIAEGVKSNKHWNA
jgi:EAL domain-containing protein (putative c-di-GMP-specific phosphodiesterase class I)